MWREVLIKQANQNPWNTFAPQPKPQWGGPQASQPMSPAPKAQGSIPARNPKFRGLNQQIAERLQARPPVQPSVKAPAKPQVKVNPKASGWMKYLRHLKNPWVLGGAGLAGLGAGGYYLYNQGQPDPRVQQAMPVMQGQPY